MLKGTTHPTTREEVYDMYAEALLDVAREFKGIVINGLKFSNRLHHTAVKRVLTNIGYALSPTGTLLFRQHGYEVIVSSAIYGYDQPRLAETLISNSLYMSNRLLRTFDTKDVDAYVGRDSGTQSVFTLAGGRND